MSTTQSSTPLPHAELSPSLDVVQGRYRLRFARTEGDLDEVCRLRFDVFNLELGEGMDESHITRRDTDQFDVHCQHLMVIDQKSEEVVGTYRLQVSDAAEVGEGFYSATEFELNTLPREMVHDSIELGRACVARKHRNRKVLFMLWKGLMVYLRWHEKRYFFGCSSLTSQDAAMGLATYRLLGDHGHLHPELQTHAQPGYECISPDAVTRAAKIPDSDIQIPPLFGMYLRYGAKLIAPPAIDRAFGTIDFLTLIDTAQLDPKVFQTFAL
jgi:putative hemolysin